MASFNVSLDDSSPLISYAPVGAWVDTPDGDPLVQQYSGHSFHTTSTGNATATLKFNGTGVWVYGGTRTNYGVFTLTVDGRAVTLGTARRASNSTQQLLGSASSLGMGEHTAVFQSAGNGALDLDSILIESQVGTSDGSVSYSIIEDGSANVTYSGSDWVYQGNSMFTSNGTHFTGANGATATVTFAGDAVVVYGGTSFDHGNYTVSLDGAQQQQFNGGSDGQSRMYYPQALLYFATNIGNGTHSLTITNIANGNATYLDVDQIGVWRSPSWSNSTSNSSSSTLSTPISGSANPSNLHVQQADAGNASAAGASAATTKKGLSTPVLAVIISVSVLVFFLILALVIFLVKRNKKKAKKVKKKELPSPVLPMQDPEKGNPFDDPAPQPPIERLEDKSSHLSKASFVEFPRNPEHRRKMSGQTTRSAWSQSSGTSSMETLKAPDSPKMNMPELLVFPPVAPLNINRPPATPRAASPAPPPMPTPPVIPMPEALQQRRRSDSSASSSSRSSRSTMYDDDEDFSSYYRDSVVPDQASHHSSESDVPTRPYRPPGLSLHGADFHSVQL